MIGGNKFAHVVSLKQCELALVNPVGLTADRSGGENDQASGVFPLTEQVVLCKDAHEHWACVLALPHWLIVVCPLVGLGFLCADQESTRIVTTLEHWATQFFEFVKGFDVLTFHFVVPIYRCKSAPRNPVGYRLNS